MFFFVVTVSQQGITEPLVFKSTFNLMELVVTQAWLRQQLLGGYHPRLLCFYSKAKSSLYGLHLPPALYWKAPWSTESLLLITPEPRIEPYPHDAQKGLVKSGTAVVSSGLDQELCSRLQASPRLPKPQVQRMGKGIERSDFWSRWQHAPSSSTPSEVDPVHSCECELA